MSARYSLLRDPVYYSTAAAFAALTTALPALAGGAWFLPIAQTAALWLLALVAFRRASARAALAVIGLWLCVQAATLFAVTMLAPTRAELAIGGGWAYRQALLEWLYAGAPLPASLRSAPWQRLLEVAGVALGSLFSGGLLGVWFLVRSVNLAAYGAAAFAATTGSALWPLVALMPWALARIAGYAGLVATLSIVGYTGEWSPWAWPQGRRRLLWVSLALVAAGLLLETVLPPLWARLL